MTANWWWPSKKVFRPEYFSSVLYKENNNDWFTCNWFLWVVWFENFVVFEFHTNVVARILVEFEPIFLFALFVRQNRLAIILVTNTAKTSLYSHYDHYIVAFHQIKCNQLDFWNHMSNTQDCKYSEWAKTVKISLFESELFFSNFQIFLYFLVFSSEWFLKN